MNGNMVWCHSHQRFEPADDFIDFDCSDDWLMHYHLIGLTPRKPLAETPHDAETPHEEKGFPTELISQIIALKQENMELKEKIINLKKRKPQEISSQIKGIELPGEDNEHP